MLLRGRWSGVPCRCVFESRGRGQKGRLRSEGGRMVGWEDGGRCRVRRAFPLYNFLRCGKRGRLQSEAPGTTAGAISSSPRRYAQSRSARAAVTLAMTIWPMLTGYAQAGRGPLTSSQGQISGQARRGSRGRRR